MSHNIQTIERMYRMALNQDADSRSTMTILRRESIRRYTGDSIAKQVADSIESALFANLVHDETAVY